MGLEIVFAMLSVDLCQNLLSQKITIFFPMKAMSGLPGADLTFCGSYSEFALESLS